MSKLVTIKERDGRVMGEVNEHTSLATIKQECPLFFKTNHGRRETYSMYRGQLIVRNTVQFTNCAPERRTVIYLYFVSGSMANDTFHIDSGRQTLAQAKGKIDRILDGKSFPYDTEI
jgi:hypothetical protein